VHREIARLDTGRLINYHLRHDDFRLITGEEADAAMRQAGLELDDQGLMEFRDQDDTAFRIASLSAPGVFSDIEKLEFSTLGFNCFIDLENCQDPCAAYEALLKKVDELVRFLNVKVFKSTQELLTISDVTTARKNLLK
jgi:FtsZ-interacting cell division protein ZipA